MFWLRPASKVSYLKTRKNYLRKVSREELFQESLKKPYNIRVESNPLDTIGRQN